MPKEKSRKAIPILKKEFYKGLLDRNKELRYPAKHSVKLKTKQKANVENLKVVFLKRKSLQEQLNCKLFSFKKT